MEGMFVLSLVSGGVCSVPYSEGSVRWRGFCMLLVSMVVSVGGSRRRVVKQRWW